VVEGGGDIAARDEERNRLSIVGSPKYRRRYMGRDDHVTGGHEAEARASLRAKKPNRVGLFVLKLLGFRRRHLRER
jgi:hypothetical protein